MRSAFATLLLAISVIGASDASDSKIDLSRKPEPGLVTLDQEPAPDSICQRQIQRAYQLCLDTCSINAVEEFDPGTCGMNARCVCGVITDEVKL